MAEKNSSQKKHGKKASSPNPSTTSSIIEKENAHPTPERLNENEKKFILETMYRGGSPGWVCRDLGIDFGKYLNTMKEEETFRSSIESAKAALSENIAFQLFKTAMEGNVTAQTNYLKLFPPEGSNPHPGGKLHHENEEWIDRLSDKELFQLAKSMDIHLPKEFMDEKDH